MISQSSLSSIRSALLGCLEIVAFLKNGVTRFGDDMGAIKQSFVATIVIIPLVAMSNALTPEMAGQSYMTSLSVIALNWAVSSVLFMGFVFGMLYILKDGDRSNFKRFIVMYNWLNLPSFILQLPFLLVAGFGWASWEGVQNYIALQLLFAYAYQGIAIAHNFKIHWSIGLCLSMADLLCGNFVSLRLQHALF